MKARKKIYLTFDIETIVSSRSASNDYLTSVLLGALYMAEQLKERNLKATFFISLSPKMKGIDYNDYARCIDQLITLLKQYDNILPAPHIHAFNLPVGFPCTSDFFSDYSYEQQVLLLEFAKQIFKKHDLNPEAFRPGGFLVNESYYKALAQTGFKYSSVLQKTAIPNIDFTTKKYTSSFPKEESCGIVEYPLTSVYLKSIKSKKEMINLSPDFLTIESVRDAVQEFEYICINFHSFSIYQNRLLRENHKHQLWHNLCYFFIERNLNKWRAQKSIYTRHDNTITRREFVKWIDFISENKYPTFFIGENNTLQNS